MREKKPKPTMDKEFGNPVKEQEQEPKLEPDTATVVLNVPIRISGGKAVILVNSPQEVNLLKDMGALEVEYDGISISGFLKYNPDDVKEHKGIILLDEGAILEKCLVLNCAVKVKMDGNNTVRDNKWAGCTKIMEVTDEKAGLVKKLTKAHEKRDCAACTEMGKCLLDTPARDGSCFKPIGLLNLKLFEERILTTK